MYTPFTLNTLIDRTCPHISGDMAHYCRGDFHSFCVPEQATIWWAGPVISLFQYNTIWNKLDSNICLIEKFHCLHQQGEINVTIYLRIVTVESKLCFYKTQWKCQFIHRGQENSMELKELRKDLREEEEDWAILRPWALWREWRRPTLGWSPPTSSYDSEGQN